MFETANADVYKKNIVDTAVMLLSYVVKKESIFFFVLNKTNMGFLNAFFFVIGNGFHFLLNIKMILL